jgi:integrase
MGRTTDRKATPGIRERSPGHYELRAYNAATRKQIVRTYVHPGTRHESGVGIREAKKAHARLVSDIRAGKYGERVTPDKIRTLGQLLDEWIDHGETRGRSPNTIHGYRVKAERIKAGPLGDMEVAKIETLDIDRYYDSLLKDGMTRANLIHHHRILRAALNQARKWKMVPENPANDVDLQTAPKAELNVPSIDQARALVLRAAEGGSPDLGPILLFGMLTGMRRGEICGVQWSDIDWAGSRVTVRRSVWQVRSTWGIKDPKTHQVRTIALDPATVALLTARLVRAEGDAELSGVSLAADGFVWSSYIDGHAPRTPNSLTRAFHRLCRTMELEARAADPPRVESWDFRFHDLRHLSATEMVGAGVDPRTVAARLGHADPSVTLKVYAHAIESRDRDAADGLGRALTLS